MWRVSVVFIDPILYLFRYCLRIVQATFKDIVPFERAVERLAHAVGLWGVRWCMTIIYVPRFQAFLEPFFDVFRAIVV